MMNPIAVAAGIRFDNDVKYKFFTAILASPLPLSVICDRANMTQSQLERAILSNVNFGMRTMGEYAWALDVVPTLDLIER